MKKKGGGACINLTGDAGAYARQRGKRRRSTTPVLRKGEKGSRVKTSSAKKGGELRQNHQRRREREGKKKITKSEVARKKKVAFNLSDLWGGISIATARNERKGRTATWFNVPGKKEKGPPPGPSKRKKRTQSSPIQMKSPTHGQEKREE